MRRIIMLLCGVVLLCGTASATWYETDSIIWINGSETHLITNDEIIYKDTGFWRDNESIALGLSAGYYSNPTTFFMGGTWYTISGSILPGVSWSGAFYGFEWNGTGWESNATIMSGLTPGLYAYPSPCTFEMGGIWYTIVGYYTGGNELPPRFKGYNWTGTTWQSDDAIVSGLDGYGWLGMATPTVFENGGEWYVIAGADDNTMGGYGHFKGYHWNGTGWDGNATIISGLSGNFDERLTPKVFFKQNKQYLISGSWSGAFYGFEWNVTGWESNATITEGLEGNQLSTLSVFNMSDDWYTISGCYAGGFYGHQWLPPFTTGCTASSVTTETNIQFTEYNTSNTTVMEFTISSGTLDWLRVTDLIVGEWYGLYDDADGERLEMQQCQSPTTFQTNLAAGNYSIKSFEYDNVTGVHGFVYEGTTQTETPIASVAVSIYNTTWSDLTGTDASGYYAFTNLSTGTYSVAFKKDRYTTVEYQYTTPTENEMYRKDIWMQKETPPFYIRHFVTFCMCDIWGNRYADVDIVCYLDGTVDKSGTTGTDGTKTFDLYEDSEYRITFINATQGINHEITQTPRDEYYWIYINSFDWTPPENQTIRDTIDWYWTSERINVTHGWINFSYTDSASETTQIDYWINSSNNTNLYHFDTASPTAWTVNQIVAADNQTYIVHFSAAHPRFGSLVGSVKHTVSFHGLRVDFKWDEQWMYNTVAVCAIIFVGLLFSATSVNVGAVVCAMSGWMFMWMGWLSGSTTNYGMMVLATIVAIGFAMRKGETIHT